jgi:hypothetical protein
MWKPTLGYMVSHYYYLPIIVKSGHTISLYTPCLCEESASNLTQETSYGLPDVITSHIPCPYIIQTTTTTKCPSHERVVELNTSQVRLRRT